jgi:hypothetical protein
LLAVDHSTIPLGISSHQGRRDLMFGEGSTLQPSDLQEEIRYPEP